jgi:hypothetical protein
MKTYGGMKVYPRHTKPQLYMEASEHLHALTILPVGETAHGTYWIGGWVGHRAGLDADDWRQISCPARDWTPAD